MSMARRRARVAVNVASALGLTAAALLVAPIASAQDAGVELAVEPAALEPSSRSTAPR